MQYAEKKEVEGYKQEISRQRENHFRLIFSLGWQNFRRNGSAYAGQVGLSGTPLVCSENAP